MKKLNSKLSVAFVCAILGFMITYQFKTLYQQNRNVEKSKQNAEIIQENERLREQKTDYEERIAKLQEQINLIENEAAGRDNQSELLKSKLEKARLISGSTKLIGEGIIMYITPKSNIFGETFEPYNDIDLLSIVNELYAAEAEAIAINDIRLSNNGGIRNASDYILINGERISVNNQVVIKAIGNSELLEAALSFPGSIPSKIVDFCHYEYDKHEEISIPKSNKSVEFKYAKPYEE